MLSKEELRALGMVRLFPDSMSLEGYYQEGVIPVLCNPKGPNSSRGG